MATIDIQAHLDHLLKAAPEDQAELLQRVAALAWNGGYESGLDHTETENHKTNPYSTS